MNLLEARGNTNHNAHVSHLQSLVQEKQPNEIKVEIKSKASNIQNNAKNPSTIYLLVSSLILLIASVLAIGY